MIVYVALAFFSPSCYNQNGRIAKEKITPMKMELDARNRRMREFFDRKADGYDSVHLLMMDSKTAITEAMPNDAKKILDLGIGTGLELVPIFEKFPDIKVTGIDISEKMLAELVKRDFSPHVTPICGSFFTVEYGKNYDAVISVAALHHFDETDKAVLYKKIFDCLKPGGTFLNSDKVAASQEEQDLCLRDYLTDPDRYPHMDTPLTVENETKLLLAAGFRKVEWKTVTDTNYRLLTAVKC